MVESKHSRRREGGPMRGVLRAGIDCPIVNQAARPRPPIKSTEQHRGEPI